MSLNLGKQVVASQKPESNEIKDLKSLGLMIKYKRTSLKLSLTRTASLCGISDKTLRSVEGGKNVNTLTLLNIVNMLGLKMRFDEQ